ncbi:MAG TPA: hypothetical protein VNA22_01565 [Pyrinomonadaceae bacterium]|nr:hypothetical protein [Pyrinomonadaceae bacterium]
MKFRYTLFAVVVTAIVLIGISNGVTSSASEKGGSRALEGSWQVRLSPTSGSPQFDEFITFAAGGGIVESNNFPFHLLPPAGLVAGPGHGTWRYGGAQSFPFTFVKFLFLPNGQAAGTLKVAGTITYSGDTDTWTGPAAVSICNNLAVNCTQIDVTNGQATRIIAGE